MGFGIRLTPTLPGGRKTAIVLQFLTCLAYVIYMTIAGPFLIFHRLEQAFNLRSFLAPNLTQKYFLIAHICQVFFVTFMTEVLYLTFCNKMRQLLI